jgi:hypothetical protein
MFFRNPGLKNDSPLVMPVLARGKHRTPRSGACFMEFASYLAGESWSDHPACTHPALAELARTVNDRVGHDDRQRLLPLVPDVIGLTGDDVALGLRIARECALTALRAAPGSRARVLVLGLLRVEAALAEHDGRAVDELTPQARVALRDRRGAVAWAGSVGRLGVLQGLLIDTVNPAAVIDYAVSTIADDAIDNPGTVLVDLLQRVIALCHVWLGSSPQAVTAMPPVVPAPH